MVEAGINQPGEMASLAGMIEGDLTIVTTIGAAHLEQLLNLETVAKEKSQLAYCARADSPVFMPAALLEYPAFAAMSARVWALCTEQANKPSNTLGCTQVAFDTRDCGRTRMRLVESNCKDASQCYELATCSQGMLEERGTCSASSALYGTVAEFDSGWPRELATGSSPRSVVSFLHQTLVCRLL